MNLRLRTNRLFLGWIPMDTRLIDTLRGRIGSMRFFTTNLDLTGGKANTRVPDVPFKKAAIVNSAFKRIIPLTIHLYNGQGAQVNGWVVVGEVDIFFHRNRLFSFEIPGISSAASVYSGGSQAWWNLTKTIKAYHIHHEIILSSGFQRKTISKDLWKLKNYL